MNDKPRATPTCKSTQNEDDDDDSSIPLSGSNELPESNVELAQGQNPWLPAYGFQIQHHPQFQPTHDDLRANDTVLVQQVDFLETILEETSDDLQSDSDRSGTTYWLGSDSETDSVIHIGANLVAADDRLDGSDSECNSVVPKKRRRKNGIDLQENGVPYGDDPLTSPRLSRSSGSSRSSSLLQFESLERTCATLSPSSYSFDSLEYSNRSNSHFETTSPDSLEQDYERVPNGLSRSNDKAIDTFVGKIRPYRSLESLKACQKEENARNRVSNGFSSLYSDRKYDLSRTRGNDDHRRDFWHADDDDYDDDYDGAEEDPEEDETDRALSRFDRFDERTVFREVSTSNYATSLDCRNTIDLREIGIETKRDAVHDLKSGQAVASSSLLQSRLNIAGNMARSAGQQGWSEPHFNNRFTDKSQSAPSLASVVFGSGLLEDRDDYSLSTSGIVGSCRGLGFENYTRVASVPVGLDLCGTYPREDHAPAINTTRRQLKFEEHEMADPAVQDDATASSVRTQDTQREQRVLLERQKEVEETEEEEEEERRKRKMERHSKHQQQVTSTVKTQDRSGGTLEIAMAMDDGDIDAVVDEAIKQFKREVEEAEAVQRPQVSSGRGRRSVRNNASYELAQQFEISDRNLMRMPLCPEAEVEDSPRPAPRRRVLNNASYELAQQHDYIKTLQSTRPFQRMDACDELEEPANRHLKVSELVEEMSRGLCSSSTSSRSASNLVTESGKESLSPAIRAYSRSTENVSANVVDGKRRGDALENRRSLKNARAAGKAQVEQESLLSQIKKNSDLFSMYGGGASQPPLLDDEVDFPYLENKPIETRLEKGILDSNDNRWMKISEIEDNDDDDDDDDEEAEEDETVTTENNKRCNGDERNPDSPVIISVIPKHPPINGTSPVSSSAFSINARSSSPSRMSFLGEFYSELSSRQDRSSIERSDRCHVDRAEVSCDQSAPVWNTERRRGSVGAVATDKLAKVTTTIMAEKEAKKGSTEGETGGDNVDGVYDSPPGHTESQIRSGNGAVAVTNRMDNRNDSDSTVRGGMSTSAKPDDTTAARKKGLGGFLQRFSKLRFSGRSKVPRSEVQKKSDAQVNRARVQQAKVTADVTTTRKKEPDYIIIPLHPTTEEEKRKDNVVTMERNVETIRKPVDLDRSGSNVSCSARAPVSSKPPLPPQPPRAAALGARPTSGVGTRRRATTDLGNPAAIEMAKARTMQAGSVRPVGLLETDLDAPEGVATPGTNAAGTGKKTRSLLNLNHTRVGRETGENVLHASPSTGSRTPDDGAVGGINQRPHKSMEFLLDKENLHFVKPPENELQKVGERVPSEHELRVQRSLQRLNVPDWYRNSPAARDGFRLKRHSDASQHGGWRALGSKTTSLSSLSSSTNRQPTTGALLSPSPTPPVFSRWSTSLLNSAGSSPASSARSSFNHRQPYLGWRSQERLANPRTPAERLAQGILPQLQSANKQQQQQTTNQQLEVRNSIKEVTSAIVHYVQSGQEVGGGGRLSPRPRPDDWDDRGGARSTSPRGSVKLCWMESSFVGSRPVDSPETPMSLTTEADCCAGCDVAATEPCSCVESTTSALYLDLTPTRDGINLCASTSPSYDHQHHHYHHRQHHRQRQQQQRRGSDNSDTEEAMAAAALLRNKPSPGSTTLEDVLDSLLGLPSASRTPSPGPGSVSGFTSVRHQSNVNVKASTNTGKSCSELRQDLQESVKANVVDADGPEDRASYYVGELVRRKSEGSDSTPPGGAIRGTTNLRNRRVSFDNVQDNGNADKTVRCRNNKCNNVAPAHEAKRSYKSCHNCTCLYCSRECRRAHWQRHRRTCLHSRAGTLCRQVLSAAKEDSSSLRHVSALAKRGYVSHGRGTVKCFFSAPEAAEKFIANGIVDLGEPTYVRWSDLLPSEMGAELYAEVMRLCKSYNPDTRLVLYVAVCVVSEVPTSGAVKWERQLVSRCAKIRLDSSFRQPASTITTIPPIPGSDATTSQQQAEQPQPDRQTFGSPCNITRDMDSPETLVLTSFPGGNGKNTPERAREISFTNIQRQLRLRGVSLRRHFPQVYKKLCSYVDGSVDKFAPVTIYPRDQASGKSFMCIIMLDAEPERLQLLPTDSSRVRTVDISIEQD